MDVLANDTPSEFKKPDPSQHQHTLERFIFTAYIIIRLIRTDMEARLIVAVVFICAVCRFTEAQLQNTTALTNNITRTACGTTKLCVSTPSNCDPAGNSSCFFSSTQYNNSTLTVELSGTTSGYVALGLTPIINLFNFTGTAVFVCGNNNNSTFFETAIQNGSVLTPANLTALNISSVPGNASVFGNGNLVQCVFSITLNSTILTSILNSSTVQLYSNITIFNGTTNGTLLGNATTLITTGPFDLANPKSNIPSTPPLNITRTACGTTKLCVSTPSNCDPAGNSSCYFSSTQYNNATLTVELSGTTSGYVALGLTPTINLFNFTGTAVFVCGNNNNSTFFETAIQNGSVLTPANLTALNISSVPGNASVFGNGNLVQCVFSITLNSTILTSILNSSTVQLYSNITIFNGTTNGTLLGNATTLITTGPFDLANPKSNIPSTPPLNITRTACGTTKLCVSTPSNCDPAGNSSCYFSSTQYNNATLTVELSGTTSGYVALGLTPTTNLFNFTGTAVFVCGNNNNSTFFETAIQNGSVLTPANLTALNISSVQGSVLGNGSLVQCVFNVTLNSTFLTSIINSSPVQLYSNITIFNGTTNGTLLGNATTLITTGPFDLANPKSNIPSTPPFNISRSGCNTSKLCVSEASTCDPAGNSSCFFSSFQVNTQSIYYELSGTTSGYVALGLTNQTGTFVFLCGYYTANSSFFFQTAIKNGSSLNLTTLNTVNSNQGFVTQNLIQCVFNTSATLSTRASNTALYTISLMNGTTNGTRLGDPNTLYTSPSAVDLSNPNALNTANTNFCTNVLAVLLAALTLHLV
ncbi:location of vulva defective 1 [Ictalurus furcatus]|uniref:location of vulva defective 1 n=1 Tax=Ictalurus furcatus TaxID=66913 RepID=UPI0023502D66|nr:location of vulva defective 1 [Ictalurus furcatus]